MVESQERLVLCIFLVALGLEKRMQLRQHKPLQHLLQCLHLAAAAAAAVAAVAAVIAAVTGVAAILIVVLAAAVAGDEARCFLDALAFLCI